MVWPIDKSGKICYNRGMNNNQVTVPGWVWTLIGWLIFIAIIVAIGIFNDHRPYDPADNYVSPQCYQAAAC